MNTPLFYEFQTHSRLEEIRKDILRDYQVRQMLLDRPRKQKIDLRVRLADSLIELGMHIKASVPATTTPSLQGRRSA